MNNLEYSIEALSAKGLFYNKDITVYVEGKDDILFWENIFKLVNKDVYVEDKGGKEELFKLMNQIIINDVEIYIALDNENSEFLLNRFENYRILRTYGHSIENSIYFNCSAIEDIIKGYCKKNISILSEINKWIIDFSKLVDELIIYDLASKRFNKGVKILGDNCCRFLKNSSSHIICKNKIDDFLNSVKDKFEDGELLEIRCLIEYYKKDLWFLIKGHFISNALINFIKYIIKREVNKKIQFNIDDLYASTINKINDYEDRIDLNFIIQQINNI